MTIPYTISTVNVLNADFTRTTLFSFSFIYEIAQVPCEVNGIACNTIAEAKKLATTVIEAMGAEISGLLAERALAALGVEPGEVTAYGKGAIVGTAGEIEHAAALIHPRFGAPVRKVVIQVVAGRNIAVLVEAAVRNTILQLRGIDTYEKFVTRHREAMRNNQMD